MLSNRRRTYLNYLFENMTYLTEFDDRYTLWTNTKSSEGGADYININIPILGVYNGFNLSSYNRLLFMTDNNGVYNYNVSSNGFHVFTARRNEDFKSVASNLKLFNCEAYIKHSDGSTSGLTPVIKSIEFDENKLYVNARVSGHSSGDITASVYLGLINTSSANSVNHLTIFGINE